MDNHVKLAVATALAHESKIYDDSVESTYGVITKKHTHNITIAQYICMWTASYPAWFHISGRRKVPLCERVISSRSLNDAIDVTRVLRWRVSENECEHSHVQINMLYYLLVSIQCRLH